MTSTLTTDAPASSAAPGLAEHVRASSREQHSSTEQRPFIAQLMGGERSMADYTRYLGQFAWVYESLERLLSRCAGCPIFDSRLDRLAAIESDLAALGVIDWRTEHPALPATQAYARHLDALESDDVPRILAHHYTRYLGDLSGGQAIARLVARHYGATPEQLSFYRFDGIDDIVHYKRAYRAGMNQLGFGAEATETLVAEVDLAFRFNGGIFDELAA